jgi:Dicarboxylate transport
MSGNPAGTRPSRPRRIARRAAIGAALLAIVLLLTYAMTPALVAWVGPRLAARYGLNALAIEIGHPGLHGLALRRLMLANDAFAVVGRDAIVSYSLAGVRNGNLDSIDFGTLEIARTPGTAAAAPDVQAATPWRVPTLPVGQLRVQHLILRSADIGFVGSGQAAVGDGALSVTIDGIEPEAASHFTLAASLDRDGRYQADFGERGDASRDFLRVHGLIGADVVRVDADVDLSGFALALIADMAGLPDGTGSVSGIVHTDIPWPLPDPLDWRSLVVGVPHFDVHWQSRQPDLTIERVSGRLALSGGRVSGSLMGRVVYRSGAGSIGLQMPKPHSFDFDGTRLTGNSGLLLRVAQGDDQLSATVNSYSIETTPDLRLSVEADVKAGIAGVGIDGRVAGSLNLHDAQATRSDGRVAVSGTVEAIGRKDKVAVTTDFRLSGRDLRLDGQASSGIFRNVPFSAAVDLESGRGTLSARHHLKFKKPLAAAILADWGEPYDLDAGDLDAELRILWDKPASPIADIGLVLRDGRAHYDKDTATGISGDLKLTFDEATPGNGWTLQPTTLRAEQVDAGLEIEKLSVAMAFAADSLRIDHLEAELLGGRARTGPFTYTVTTGVAEFALLLENVDLAQVLALEGEDVVGTGTLDGTLPVLFSGHLPRIDKGSFRARPPGGSIHVNPSFTSLTGQSGLNFALLALKDFNYTDLSGELDYAESGDLQLAIHLKGNNPAVEKGRPIQYNLNISENVPKLLESLRMSDRVTERISRDVVN